MVMKAYIAAWAASIALAGLIFYTGGLNEISTTIMGFVFATLAFGGIVAVLPWWVDKHYSWT